MQEGNELSRRSLERLFVDQAHPGAGGLRELAGDVVSSKSDVMDALATVRQKSGNGTFRRSRLQQFQMNAADIEEGRTHLLGGNFLAVLAAQSKRSFVNRHSLVE
jgi:hypothetical protein